MKRDFYFKALSLLCLHIIALSLTAQEFNPLIPPNTYRAADNPYYWKNKLPHPGYWQQDVHYTIKANIDENTDIISATQQLEYFNNSPHDLDFVYFHLYQNAFQPGSYYDDLTKANKENPTYGTYESQGLGTEVLSMKINGQELKRELDNTILKVYLPTSLKSGQRIVFDIEFKTYFEAKGEVRRRMKMFNAYGYKHYDGVHWYPRIAVYDRKFGWCTDQHLGKEFYGNFGTYDVELTFANNFILDATGNLLNREEVLPDELRKKLDLYNFRDKEWGSPPSEIIPYDASKRKTWKFHAENVHDFAFTADPTYRIGETEWNGIKCIALVQEPHSIGWLKAPSITAKIIQIYSEDIGMYAHHKMIVADARDGMEYPMLTLDGGFDPNNRSLLAHEIGHNWFYGQVANNETYRASLDEGFTQFLTSWAMERIDGDTLQKIPPRSAYTRLFKNPDLTRYNTVYYGYLRDATRKSDAPLNTHSDMFQSALGHGGGYGHVYFKTATMLYNLQYVLGDSLFLESMKNYFAQWRGCNPYPEDFRNSIIQFSRVDLNWFFDQWMETTKTIDYGIKKIKRAKNNEYHITFVRKGEMQMPIDFTVIDKSGKKYHYTIPNTWFAKESEATVLPRWIGWDLLRPEYTAVITLNEALEKVEIDPSDRLADVDRRDNSSATITTVRFDSRISNYPKVDKYEIFVRPDVWYNSLDGIKAGLHINSHYMEFKHKIDFTVWTNTSLAKDPGSPFNLYSGDPVNFRLDYEHPIYNFMKGASINVHSRFLDGLWLNKAGFTKKTDNEKSSVYAYFKSLYRINQLHSTVYLLNRDHWQKGRFNNSINVGLNHTYKYIRGTGNINLHFRGSFLSDYEYSYANFTSINETRISKFVLRTRSFAQAGLGNNWAPESQLYAAGANPEELMENKYTRSQGFFPTNWFGYGSGFSHFHAGGGLNLRAFAGYLMPTVNEQGLIVANYLGQSGASFNTELEFNKFIPLRNGKIERYFGLKTYLFGDIGILNTFDTRNNFSFTDLRADAGIGTAFTIKKFGALEKVKPLTIRFDMPLFANKVPPGMEYMAFRWIVGINRAF